MIKTMSSIRPIRRIKSHVDHTLYLAEMYFLYEGACCALNVGGVGKSVCSNLLVTLNPKAQSPAPAN